MNCRDAERQIAAERGGALEARQRAALKQHVATCASCRTQRAELDAALASWKLSTEAAALPDSTREWESVRRTIRHKSTQPAPHRRHLLSWVALPQGAAAALMLTLWTNQAPAPAPASAPTVARTSNDSVEVSAADGSVVFVDDKSGWVVIWETPTPPRQI
jgi:anti-sigma factor RsiW